ncbi:hypothetical protein RFM99_26255 [Mesorhizobium sp. VK4C]|nr:hypothetical protein [Mesorhizobium sp. VK4C]
MIDRNRTSNLKLPQVVTGDWRGEIVGAASVNFGQVVQPGSVRQSVEFTHMILAAMLTMPNRGLIWPGIVMNFLMRAHSFMTATCLRSAFLLK